MDNFQAFFFFQDFFFFSFPRDFGSQFHCCLWLINFSLGKNQLFQLKSKGEITLLIKLTDMEK